MALPQGVGASRNALRRRSRTLGGKITYGGSRASFRAYGTDLQTGSIRVLASALDGPVVEEAVLNLGQAGIGSTPKVQPATAIKLSASMYVCTYPLVCYNV